MQRLLQVLRLLRAIGVAPPEVPTFASALPDYAADAPIEALLRVHVTDPLLAVYASMCVCVCVCVSPRACILTLCQCEGRRDPSC